MVVLQHYPIHIIFILPQGFFNVELNASDDITKDTTIKAIIINT